MSIARGILSGFLKEGLEQKAARDEMYADMVRETGTEFRKTAQLFRKEEENIEKRFKLIEADLGTPFALYASYNGLTTSDAGTNLILDRMNDPNNAALKKQIEEFDFQGYDFNTAKTQRFMNFKDQQKDVFEILGKNQFPVPVAELAFKDMKAMDTGAQVARPELQLPALSSSTVSTAISPKDMRLYRDSAFRQFEGLERNKNSKRFKDNFAVGYDETIHGPSKDLYAFERYFKEFYLPGVIGVTESKTMETQMQDMGATTEAGTTTGGDQTTDTTTTPIPFEGDVIDYSSDNPKYFSYNGKLYNVPERFIKKNTANPESQQLLDLQNKRRGTNFNLPEFTVQSLPEITKKAIAAEQDKLPPTKDNPNVLAAQQTINIIRAQNPNDPRIEDIKRDLRLILGVTNLDGLIS
jgi:hypothetical protein